MLSVSNVNTAISPQFKGNDNTKKKTHAGLYLGSAMAAGATALTLLNNRSAGIKTSWIGVAISILTNTGCGAIVDKFLNDKREAGETTKGTGKKVGAVLGAVVAPINGLIAKHKGAAMTSTMLGIKSKVGAIAADVISGIGVGLLGGYGLGAITEHFAKKSEN